LIGVPLRLLVFHELPRDLPFLGLAEGVGGEFDPETFDLEAVNKEL
jgi:hypothetical protein